MGRTSSRTANCNSMESMSLFASLSLFPVRRGVNYVANIFMRPELRSGFIIRKTSSRKHFCTVRSTVQGGFRGTKRTSGEEEGTRSFIWQKKQNPRICILGGGFGGLYTALRLESLEWPPDKKPQVLLVDQSEHFVFKPLLYELLTGEVDEWEVAPRFSELLSNTSVQFVRDRVKEISPSDHFDNNDCKQVRSGGQVHLESGLVVDYDWLVLSLGAQSKLDAVPGASDFALPFQSLEDARERIQIWLAGSGARPCEVAERERERTSSWMRVPLFNLKPKTFNKKECLQQNSNS